jgi:hypothetical protein
MFTKIYDKIYNSPIAFNSIIILLYIIYSYYTSSTLLLDSLDEVVTGHNTNNSPYTAYNYNYVETSQGYRTELDGNPVKNVNPYPCEYPQHAFYDPAQDKSKYAVDSRIPYNLGHPNTNVEPSESFVKDNGYYYHTGNERNMQYIPPRPNLLKRAKNKIHSFASEMEKNMNDYNKWYDEANYKADLVRYNKHQAKQLYKEQVRKNTINQLEDMRLYENYLKNKNKKR